MGKNCDFSGWATRANLKCSDGRIIMKGAFIEDDGREVPLVWNHNYSTPDNVMGKALLEHREDGVYAYCYFNDSESGVMGRELVKHGDIKSLSIAAHSLKQRGSEVLHGVIRELSLVLAGANPGAYIETVMCHGEKSEDEAIIYTGEDIVLAHAEEESESEDNVLEHAEEKEDNTKMAENKEQVKEEAKTEEKSETKTETKEKTVKDVVDGMTDEQREVMYALIGQAIEDAGVTDDEETEETEEVKHSEGGNDTMYTNVFDREAVQQTNVLNHADQAEILEMAKRPSCGSLKLAMQQFAENHKDTLSHGFGNTGTGDDVIGTLFPDYKDVYPGAPELIERDMGWVGQVLKKAHKSPVSRVRTIQIDAKTVENQAKGYSNRERQKVVAEAMKVMKRTTDPQTIYYRDALHRDDIVDITDFDVVAYQKNIMKHGLEEKVAVCALLGDVVGVDETHADDFVSADHIRPVWTDAPLFAIHGNVDIETAADALQGTNTSASFGEEFIFAEAFIAAALNARVQYKGKGTPDCYISPYTLNKMLLARDMNGRRIYESAADLAKVLNVGNVFTVEQMDNLTRTDEDDNTYALHAIIVDMANYQFGCAKGGEITSFEQFDIDFNNYKYLMETRLSGALTRPYSAIVLETKTEATVSAG